MAVVFSSMKDMRDLYYHILQLEEMGKIFNLMKIEFLHLEMGKNISFNEDRINLGLKV